MAEEIYEALRESIQMLETTANELDEWCEENRKYGYSTNLNNRMTRKADDFRRRASQLRRLIL